MAGIGFELRKILKRESLSSTLSAYLYAGVISAGPLILSIFGILLIGVLSLSVVEPPTRIVQFQVSVTYLIAASLIVTGALQLSFTRFISDRLFEKKPDRVLPSYNAVTLVATVVTGVLGLVLALTTFQHESVMYRMLMLVGFVIVSNIWICVIFLTSIKQYRAIILTFFIGYSVTVVFAVALNRFGLEGLLGGFVFGHLVLLIGLASLIHRNYDSDDYISWEVFDRRFAYPTLIFVGLLFNLGVWLDKFMFWFSGTGQNVIGPLRASVIYDVPVFIAYICIIPGMAVFLLRLETDFVDHYDGYYRAVRTGDTLAQIRNMRNNMVRSARIGLYEILKIQAVVVLLIFAFGDKLLRLIGISTLYLPLLHIDVIAASLQVLFLGILNIFFYLDKRLIVLVLTATFVVLNGLFTWITQVIGPNVYGYGFAGALLLVVLLGTYLLDRRFDDLEYDTYMLQKSS
ncbi:exopolysaccharide Pel transporter PelG [Eoetvoesiella caeni]|uniref:Putative membrane protein n=1 Tax=Eoetvoesiella caeni TaxID=645616 RepID=A0A366H2W7_9BURK|nr:exopolysaccharide Pel transporter PelG [Eoetvoesiella caeni]MCI2810883.1 exopolysaccharide Pel transporter PelG [Eoetvoesiella caeni]NYT56818.1 exopolysaccharide Pel transporter PelG [Eoetvoesiella caeni]RBP35616.1 putative membrane protein [Eoetvoesiella caeni]